MDNRVTVAVLDAWLRAFARLVAEHEDELTRLDAAIGDADHGANMNRGLTAATATLDEPAAAGPILAHRLGGWTWSSRPWSRTSPVSSSRGSPPSFPWSAPRAPSGWSPTSRS